MKIPKYIDEALKRRTRGAVIANNNDRIITNFIEKYGIDVNSEEYCGGVEQYANPYESEKTIREAIKAHKK